MKRRQLLLAFWPAEVDLALTGNGGDERRIEFAAEATHFGDGQFQGGGHVLAGHVAGGKDEFADGVLLKSAFFKEVVADAFVRGEQGPAIRADERQPNLVGDAPREVREMSLKANA